VTLRRLTAVLALIGIAIAGYLTWVHYAGLEPVCVGGGGGCERVQSSRWAELAGIPVAVLGLGGYIVILGSLLLHGVGVPLLARWHHRAVAAPAEITRPGTPEDPC